MEVIHLKRYSYVRNFLGFFLLAALMTVPTACEPAPDQYNLTIASTEGGSVVKPGEGIFTLDSGSEVELIAFPHEGYRFANWTGDVYSIASIFSSETTITVDSHLSITAEFEVIDDISMPPFAPEWNPQKQALLPDREFDTNWTLANNWFPALHRGISAIWLSWDPGPSMITSPDNENVSTMLGLSEGHPPGSGPIILRCIFAKDLPGGVQLDLIVRLYDGETLIEEWIEEDVPATWTIREYELSTDLQNWDDLRVELAREGETEAPEPNLRRVLVSLVEMEIPYPEEFIFPYMNPATTTHSPRRDTVHLPLAYRKAT
jgi:hypothetical protein